MDCPVCREPMIVLDYDAVEVDFCVACQGIWLDAGEMELLVGDAGPCAAPTQGGRPPAKGEARRRCPICRKKMAKVVTAGEHPVVYDRCVRGDGLWFDKGELGHVLTHGVAVESGEHLTRFLREMFPDKAP